MDYDASLALVAQAVGALIGGLFWFGVLAAIVHLCNSSRTNAEKRAGIVLAIGTVLITLALLNGYTPAIFNLPPLLIVWWLYRRWLRGRAIPPPSSPS